MVVKKKGGENKMGKDGENAKRDNREEWEFEPFAAGFGHGESLDELRPGPVLAAAVSAVADTDLSGMNEDELLGLVKAARRMAAWAGWAQTVAEAEYADRHTEWDPAVQQEVVSDLASQELAQEIPLSGGAARDELDRSRAATHRLPRCLELANAGVLDPFGMRIICEATAGVDPELIAKADRLIAEAAAGKTPGQLRRLCTLVVMATDPEAIERNRKGAAKTKRVEIRQEYSGNGSVAAREISVADTMAIKQALSDWARAMKRAGLAGTLDNLRADALTSLVLGRDPVVGAGERASDGVEPTGQDPFSFQDSDDEDGEGEPDSRGGAGSPAALINILVPSGLLDRTSGTPAEVAGFGFIGGEAAREMVAAASRNPATRWCVTIVNPADGTAQAHGCARGSHRWTPPATGPPGEEIARFLASLNVRFEPIAKEVTDPSHPESRHDPSRKLTHLIRARSATCATPGCGAAAVTTDMEHTIPWEQGGETSERNLRPACRHHHKVKQHPAWTVEQVKPGLTKWTGPAGRSRYVYPTRYQL